MDNIIKNYGNKYKKEYALIKKYLRKYNKICLFRHVSPDFDALGSQLGFYYYLKEKFPMKDIKVVGEDHPELSGPDAVFQLMDVVDDSWFDEPFLAIITDVSDKPRISDPRFSRADCIIKIDHHPNNNNFANVNITDTNCCAACEIVANMLYNLEHMTYIGYNAAKNLYIGVVGDSGRFMYSSTTAHTFMIANKLVQEGLILPYIYAQMYTRDVSCLEVQKTILNTFKISPHGVAYYVFTNDDLERLNLDQISGKDYVNTFSNLRGIEIWSSITQDIEKGCYWVSLRSKGLPVNTVAAKYEGGGHVQASGCKLHSLSELPKLINDLDELIVTSKNN